MRVTNRVLLGFVLTIMGTVIFATFMVVFDELFALALYCGIDCRYPFPWSAPLEIWSAWVWTFTGICIGVGTIVIGVGIFVTGIMILRRLEK